MYIYHHHKLRLNASWSLMPVPLLSPLQSVLSRVAQLLKTSCAPAPVYNNFNPLSVWSSYFVLSVHNTNDLIFDSYSFCIYAQIVAFSSVYCVHEIKDKA